MTGRTLRRYPALGFLAVAALLASLLPSALRVPLSGPSASAELAPVPGKSDSAQGDLSALGQASTGGLGSGSGLEELGGGGRNRGRADATEIDAGEGTPDAGSGRNPAQKRCVGKPPRQTEDPLSPPCVAYFKGDNGGATAKGVTRDEIVIVHHKFDQCPAERVYFDYESDHPWRDPAIVAYARYFNERFQTYGRRVHVYGVVPTCDENYKNFWMEVNERLRPFFVIGPKPEPNAMDIARTETITTVRGAKRAISLRFPPFVLSYPPDLDNNVESAVEFLCARLAGRAARFALDPDLRDRRRKFGLFYDAPNLTDLENEGAAWFVDGVKRRCGEAAGEIVVGHIGRENETFDQLPGLFARMRAEGVTTAVMLSHTLLPSEAASFGWRPEWFAPDNAGIGRNARGRVVWSAQGNSVFGFHAGRRLGSPNEQMHRRAHAEACACGDAPSADWLDYYEQFFLLFSGIQAAGPKLTPANLDKGLHALPVRRSLDPFTPAAYFAPGNYSFVKDFAAVWWDPLGRPPGSNNVGCWRLIEDGLRYRSEDWRTRPGDDGIQGQGQPCQGDEA